MADRAGKLGMRVVFWTWMAVIAGGLADMIALPVTRPRAGAGSPSRD